MKKEYEEKLRAQLARWRVEIDELRTKSDGAEGDKKSQYAKRMAELKELRAVVETRLADAKEAKGAALEDVKAGAEQAKESLKGAFKSALSRFK